MIGEKSTRSIGGVLGDGGARTERGRGREIDGRATKGFERIAVEIDAKANRSLHEGKGRPIDSSRLFRQDWP